jgi:Ca2+-binding EF-hand superfamily protein
MKRVLIAIGVSAIAAGIATAAPAQMSPEAGKQMFDKVDTNHDGVLTLDEWKAAGRRERGFNMIDTDHDGKVTPDELRAAAARFGR